jgi:hypothetical protein
MNQFPPRRVPPSLRKASHVALEIPRSGIGKAEPKMGKGVEGKKKKRSACGVTEASSSSSSSRIACDYSLVEFGLAN